MHGSLDATSVNATSAVVNECSLAQPKVDPDMDMVVSNVVNVVAPMVYVNVFDDLVMDNVNGMEDAIADGEPDDDDDDTEMVNAFVDDRHIRSPTTDSHADGVQDDESHVVTDEHNFVDSSWLTLMVVATYWIGNPHSKATVVPVSHPHLHNLVVESQL